MLLLVEKIQKQQIDENTMNYRGKAAESERSTESSSYYKSST
jgi:hypothetical protein